MIRVGRDVFSGGAGLADGQLSGMIRALATNTAKIAAGTVADLTDNSGGAAADGAIPDVPLCTTAPAVDDNVPTKAAAETALGKVKDGLTEIAAKIAAVAARVPAFSVTNNIGGAAADGTIAAFTVAPTADNTGPSVSRTGFNAVVTAARNLVRELASDINVLAVACGVAPLTGTAAGTKINVPDHVYAALSTDTGAAPADESGSVTVAESTASLTALRDAVAEMAAKLNAITTDTTPAAVLIVN